MKSRLQILTLRATVLSLILLSPIIFPFVLNSFNQDVYFELFNTNDIIWQENIWVRYYEFYVGKTHSLFTWVGMQNPSSSSIVYVDRLFPRLINYIFSSIFGFYFGTIIQFFIGFLILSFIDKCDTKEFLVKWLFVFFFHIISLKYLLIDSYSSVPVIIRAPENLFSFVFVFYFFQAEFSESKNILYFLFAISLFFSVHLFLALGFLFFLKIFDNRKLVNSKLVFVAISSLIYGCFLIHNKGSDVFNHFVQFYTGGVNNGLVSLKSEFCHFILYSSVLFLLVKNSGKIIILFSLPVLVAFVSWVVHVYIQPLHFRLYFFDFLLILTVYKSHFISNNRLLLVILLITYYLFLSLVNIEKFESRSNNRYLPYLLDEIHNSKYQYPTFWNGNSYEIQIGKYRNFLREKARNPNDSTTAGSLMIHYYENNIK